MIKTYNDLVQEKERLRLQLVEKKQKMGENWGVLKDELSPVNNAFGVIGKMTKGDTSNPLVTMGLRLASETLLKNLLFARAGWLTKLAVPLLVKNFSSHLVVDKGRSLVQKIRRGNWGKVFRKKDAESELT